MTTAVATSLSTLLTPMSIQQVFQTLLGVYQANGFPVQSWQTGGVERTRLMAFSTALVDVSANYIPQLAAAGFVDYAGNVSAAWLQLLAQEMFNIPYNVATNTVGNITATTTATAGPYTFTAGQLIAVFAASGNRYFNTGSGTIPQNGSLVIPFQAEFAGAAYSDGNSQGPGGLTLVTPLPGVTLNNPAGTFSSVAHVGSGTGSVAASGAPASPHSTMIRIDLTGATGVASWSYSLDGAPFVSAGAVSSAAIGSSGITVTLTGALSTSFILNDTYSFANPGSWITTQGSNVETNTALAARCVARWASLSSIPVNNLYYLLATSTPGVGGQVTQAIVFTDAVINNKVNIVVSGPAGALPPATVAAIQTYINPRVPTTDYPVVVSPSTTIVTPGAVITVKAALLSSVQAAVQTALTNYINGGLINPTLRISVITDLVMNLLGTVDITGITLNGSSSNLTLGSSSSFVVAALPTSNPFIGLSYITV